MAVPASVLMVELVMSADRVISAAQSQPAEAVGGAWPPAVVLGHLSLVDHEVWLPRIDQMVAARGSAQPELTWWEPDNESTVQEFDGVLVDEAGARLLSSRTALLHRLRGLSPQEWDATANHAVFGVIDIAGLVLQVLAHDEEHRASLLLPALPAG